MTHLRLPLLLLLAILALTTLGCASGGADNSGMAATAAEDPAPPEVDLDAVGENGLLTPSAVLGRFVEAIGGREAIESHSSATVKGTFGMPAMGVEGDMTLYIAAPDKMVMNIEMAGMGSMSNGYNGEVGWSDNPMTGPALLEGELLAQTKEQASFYAPLTYDDIYPTQKTLEIADFNGESAYKVSFTNGAGRETVHYFSQESALLIGTEGVQTSEMGEAEVTTVLSDYEDFGGGILQPATTTMKMMGMEIIQKTLEVSWDEVPEEAFEPPASIKALME